MRWKYDVNVVYFFVFYGTPFLLIILSFPITYFEAQNSVLCSILFAELLLKNYSYLC